MMVSRDRAVELADRFCDEVAGLDADAGTVRELADGWFVGWKRTLDDDGLLVGPIGCNGVIVNKGTGDVFALGSAYPIDRDLHFYHRGFRSKTYDLVILEIHDLDPTLDSLERIGPCVAEPEYESGTVWRIPRKLTRSELLDRVRTAPCVFGDLRLYFRLEELARAEEEGWYRFRAIGRRETAR